MTEYWMESTEELKKKFHVTEDGLTQDTVRAIRSEKGENILREGKRKSLKSALTGKKKAGLSCSPDELLLSAIEERIKKLKEREEL